MSYSYQRTLVWTETQQLEDCTSITTSFTSGYGIRHIGPDEPSYYYVLNPDGTIRDVTFTEYQEARDSPQTNPPPGALLTGLDTTSRNRREWDHARLLAANAALALEVQRLRELVPEH